MSIKISVAAMIMRVSGPVTPHYETHGATLAIPASGARRVESPKRRVSVLIDNFYGGLENMRFVIVDSGPNRSTGPTVTAEHAKRLEFVIIGEESNNRAPRCNTRRLQPRPPSPGGVHPCYKCAGLAQNLVSRELRVGSRGSKSRDMRNRWKPGHFLSRDISINICGILHFNEMFIILDFEILITLLRLRSAIKMKIMISVRIFLLVIVCLKSPH